MKKMHNNDYCIGRSKLNERNGYASLITMWDTKFTATRVKTFVTEKHHFYRSKISIEINFEFEEIFKRKNIYCYINPIHILFTSHIVHFIYLFT